MQCKFCLYNNPEDQERCRRCGIRLSGDITFDGISCAGATALAPERRAPVMENDTNDGGSEAAERGTTPVAVAERQTSLFSGELSNVIPFESFQRPHGKPPAKTEVVRGLEPCPAARRLDTARQAIRKQVAKTMGGRATDRRSRDSQASLDLVEFLQPAPQTPRTLKTTVEASIYCDAQVATPMHRSVAAILDGAMVFIGCGVFLGVFQFLGGSVRLDRFDAIVAVCAVTLITMFYGMLFAICGRETAGQHWTELRLINFDGMRPDGPSRALRFLGCWLSFACGIGMLWALLDEENLTWHDHMSKTFLTMRESDASFFRERER